MPIDEVRTSRRWLVGLSISIGTLAALLMAEVALRLFGLGYGNAPFLSDPILHHIHEHDYVFRSYTPDGEFGGFPIRIDSDGWVVATEEGAKFDRTRHKRVVALMGDSFVEAFQVPHAQSFAGLLMKAAKGDVFVRNYGVSSYSPVLFWLQWKIAIRETRPTHVILMLYGNDVRDDLSYLEGALALDSEGLPTAVPGPGNSIVVRLLRKSYLARLLRKSQLTFEFYLSDRSSKQQKTEIGGLIEENPKLSDITKKAILKLSNDVRKRGGQFILTAVPSKAESQYDKSVYKRTPNPSFAENVSTWAHEEDIEYLDLRSAFSHAAADGSSLFFQTDIHFNRNGHRVVADTVKRSMPELFNH